jgi:hypothetical protein
LSLNKAHLTILLNFYCSFDHSFAYLGTKTTHIFQQLDIIDSNLKKISDLKLKNVYPVDRLEYHFTHGSIRLIKLIVNYANSLRNSLSNDGRFIFKNMSGIEHEMNKEFSMFYSEALSHKNPYCYWLLTLIVQFYHDFFFKHLIIIHDQHSTLISSHFFRREFIEFNMNLCYYHFNSYQVKQNTVQFTWYIFYI